MGVPRQTAALLVAIVAASGAATASSDLASAQGSAPDLSRLPLAAPGGVSLEQPFLLYEQQLPTGAVKRVYSDASVFVGDARARLSFHVNGLGLTDGMWSAEPEPASRERIVELAGQYTLRHRSLGSDAEAAGIDDQRTAEVGTRS